MYLPHYGLERSGTEGDLHQTSWNSDHRFSNYLLFSLPQHTYHHRWPRASFAAAHSTPNQRLFPLPYSCMAVAALFPPLWFALMDPLLTPEERATPAISSSALV